MNVKNIIPNKEFNIIGNNKYNLSEYLIKTKFSTPPRQAIDLLVEIKVLNRRKINIMC